MVIRDAWVCADTGPARKVLWDLACALCALRSCVRAGYAGFASGGFELAVDLETLLAHLARGPLPPEDFLSLVDDVLLPVWRDGASKGSVLLQASGRTLVRLTSMGASRAGACGVGHMAVVAVERICGVPPSRLRPPSSAGLPRQPRQSAQERSGNWVKARAQGRPPSRSLG